MSNTTLTRDEMRAAFKELDMDTISDDQLESLRDEINSQMESSDCFRGSFRMLNRTGSYLACKADYFDDREAVSFNPDGFVGFAGWADSNNVQPILRGFESWLEKLEEFENFPCNELAN